MDSDINKLIHTAVSIFSEKGDCELLLSEINVDDWVNQWVYGTEPFPSEDAYYSLVSITDFFHEDEDLLDYYDRDYFQQKTDWHRLWTLSDMGSRIEYDQCTCVEHMEMNGATVTVEVNQHGQNGFYFDNLKLFKTLDEMFSYYRKQDLLVFKDKKFHSHSDEEMLALYETHIASRI